MGCSIPGCSRPLKSRGWCHTHYMRWWKYGDPLAPPVTPSRHGPVPRDEEERFLSHVEISDTCHVWRGQVNNKGYGRFYARSGRPVYVHRWAWQHWRGPIPTGTHVLHRCDNPPCVRIDHLFLGTHADNMADAKAKGRTRNQHTVHH